MQKHLQPQSGFREEHAGLAPRGFSDEQWKRFAREGVLAIPDAIDPGSVELLKQTILQVAEDTSGREAGRTWKITRMVEKHPLFQDLIDHERHIGFAYDVFGEQLRFIQGDAFIRPPGGIVNHWHVDGPRAVPYNVFSPVLPLKLRIGYWLTDVTEPNMGNFLYVPGSHLPENRREFSGLEEVPEQKALCYRAGTITIAHANVWHRVMPNNSDRTRINLFLSYAPTWISGYHTYDPDWVRTLTREQRIILRNYSEQKHFSRPPEEDLPLFDDPGVFLQRMGEEAQKVRRRTRYERHLARLSQDDL